MKVAEVRVFPRRITDRPQLLVKVTAEDGTEGWGEAGLTGRERSIGAVVLQLGQLLRGRSIFDCEALALRANNAHYYEGGRELYSALAALDIALHDLRGRKLGCAVYDLLGGRVRQSVPLFHSLDLGTADAVTEEAQHLAADGWRALRFTVCASDDTDGKIFDPYEEAPRLAALCNTLRQAVPRHVVLGIDLHRRFPPPAFARFLDLLDRGALDFVEEPIQAHAVAAYVAARSLGGPRVALGEEFVSKWNFLPYLEAGAVDFCRLDLCLAGGFTEGRKIAALCEARYVPLMPHNPLGPVAFAANLHFGLLQPGFAFLEYQRPNDKDKRFDIAFPRRPTADSGSAAPLDAPGLGITVDEAALEALPEGEWRAPQLTDRSGGIVPW